MGQLTSKNGPSREDVTYLLRNTNYSKEAIVGWHKVFRHNTNSASLSQAQFLDLYTKFFPSGEASEYVGHVFRTYGKSRNRGKDWQLGFRDYLLAVHETQCGSEEARLRRAFKMFDVSKRGLVEERDVVGVYKSTRGMFTEGALDAKEEARRLFLRLHSLDPLGQFGGGVSEDQFVEALLVNQPGSSKSVKRTLSRLKRAKPD